MTAQEFEPVAHLEPPKFDRTFRNAGLAIDALTIGTAAVWLSLQSTQGVGDLLWELGVAGATVLVILVWLGRVARWSFFSRQQKIVARPEHYFLAPSLAIFVALLSQTNLPTRVIFGLHRPLLNAAIAKKVAPTRIGFFRVLKTEKIGDGVAFTVSKGGFLDTTYFSFAYFPSGQAPKHFYRDSRVAAKPENGPVRLNAHWFWFRSVQYFD